MTKLSVAASLVLLVQSDAFSSREIAGSKPAATLLSMAPPVGPAGSFFHKVPDESERDNTSPQNFDDINDEVKELLRQRRKPPRASNPSTIGGVPTAKATGE